MVDLSSQNDELCTKIENLLESKQVRLAEKKSFSALSASLKSFNKSSLFLSGNQKFGSYSQSLINNYLKKIDNLLSSSSTPPKDMEKVDLCCLIDKFKLLVKCLPYSYKLSEEDLECLEDSHPRKQALNMITKIKNESPDLVKTQTEKFLVKYESLKAAFLRTCQYQTSAFRHIWTTGMLIYFNLNKKQREKYSKLYNVVGRIDSMKMIWDLTESPLMRKMFPMIFPKIKFHKYLFIPRSSVKITEQGRFPDPSIVKSFKVCQTFKENTIPVNILSTSKKTLTSARKYNKLIIHVHGGGFIGQSSFSHQHYLRKWSNELKLPIFSIDYRLAPRHKFPEGLDDVWQVYVWLVLNAEEQLNVVPEKLLLIGDSAGGNFITSIALKAKECGFRGPDSMLVVYPALNMDVEYVSEGAFYSLEEPVLTYATFFEVCNHYVSDPKDLKSYLVSPVLCPDSLIQDFPKSRFMITCKDPLRSDSLRFVERLLRTGADVQVLLYPEYIHGALNLSTPSGIPVFQSFVKDAIEQILDLLG